MRIDVPYYKQDTQYTCGPTALKMLLAYLGVAISDPVLNNLMNCSAEEGTDNQSFSRTLSQLGLWGQEMTNTSIDALRTLVEKKMPVLVNYRNVHDNRGHFAVVVGMDGGDIIFNDPEYGADYRLSEEVFEQQWVSHDGLHTRWACIGGHEPFPHETLLQK